MALASVITPDAAAQLLVAAPEMFPEYDGAVRRALLNRFPYAIYYESDADRIVVLRFLAMSQERAPARRR